MKTISFSSKNWSAAAAAKLLQACLTPTDPIDGSPPGSPVPGILQARTLEWVAISFSNAWKWKVKVKSLSRVRLLGTKVVLGKTLPLSGCWFSSSVNHSARHTRLNKYSLDGKKRQLLSLSCDSHYVLWDARWCPTGLWGASFPFASSSGCKATGFHLTAGWWLSKLPWRQGGGDGNTVLRSSLFLWRHICFLSFFWISTPWIAESLWLISRVLKNLIVTILPAVLLYSQRENFQRSAIFTTSPLGP